MKEKLQKIFSIVGILLFFLIVLFVLMQTFIKPKVQMISVGAQVFEGPYYYLTAKINNEVQDFTYWITEPDTLPSDNPMDYMGLYINYRVTNYSVLQAYQIDADLAKAESYRDHILTVSPTADLFGGYVFRFDKSQEYIVVTLYTGDLSEDQIRELIDGLTISVDCYGDLYGSKHTELSLKGTPIEK